MALLKWLGELIAKHTILQIVGSAPLAYFAGVIVQAKQGAGTMLDTLPPLFWPIFAGLVLTVCVYGGIVSPVVKHLRGKKQAFQERVEDAYQKVSHACKPEILDPAHPGNPHAIREYAQNAVDIIRPQLVKKRGYKKVPPEIDVTDRNSLYNWYNYLRLDPERRT